MNYQHFTQVMDLGDGRNVTLETGKLAKQADGSVVVRLGDTMVMATVVSDKNADDGIDFLPLMVDYREMYAGAGRFPGGFFKREARPSEGEILTCRLVDRALRPLFPDDYHANTIIQIQMISSDGENMPDALACLAASAAISVSDIPFNGPVSEVRVARINGAFVINPTISQLDEADLEMVIAGTSDSIVMVEGEMFEISEEEMLEAIKTAHEVIKRQIDAQNALASNIEKAKSKREYSHEVDNEAILATVKEVVYAPASAMTKEGIANKSIRGERLEAMKKELIEKLGKEVYDENKPMISRYFKATQKKAVRDAVLDTRKRLDGRDLNEIRPIWSEVNYLPGAHGSAIFTRGETQSLTTCTLGAARDEQMIDGAFVQGTSAFLLHYNFPAFSTGEARMPRSTSRREIGHGNLAFRALKGMISPENPYTIRVVSDILESNGSSSMATVCAGSLAMMDAGVQLEKPVAGIAMGLITDAETNRSAVLSDILGDEDFLGDMDFKIAGTKDGITAVQMDIKIDGLPYDILEQALTQAKDGRLHILGEMAKTLETPREEMKPNAPRLMRFSIDKEFIGAVIGSGGKVIQEMQAVTGTTISIEEVDNVGEVEIFGPTGDAVDKAFLTIKQITATPEVDEEYEATVKSIMDYGMFVEFLPTKEGLLHISEISHARIDKMEDAGFSKGDKVKVKLVGIDNKGRYKLSRKVLLPAPAKDEGSEE